MSARAQRTRHRTCALATAVMFVVCGLLGMRHESRVAHVVNVRTGVTKHAVAIGCHEQNPTPDVHSVPGDHDPDVDACTIDAVLHQAARTSAFVAIAVAAPSPAIVVVPRPRSVSPRARLLLRSAPKTSPPSSVS
jgi:hypothetical protein